MFWIVLTGVVVFVVLMCLAQPATGRRSRVVAPSSSGGGRMQPAHDMATDWPPQVAEWVLRAREAVDAGDIDGARMCYQKAAYGFKQLTPTQNEELKRETAEFARIDPRYQAGLSLVRDALQSAPGMLQSELGKSVGDQREALNYVLYFAAMTGDIVRVKSGRSYRLYLPTQAIPETSTDKHKGDK